MTRILGCTLLTALSLATLASAQANRLRADIPFAFQIHKGETLPAGTYELTADTMGGGGKLFTLRQANGTKKSVLVTRGQLSDTSSRSQQPHLRFACIGDDCALTEIWGGEQTGYKTPMNAPTVSAEGLRMASVSLTK